MKKNGFTLVEILIVAVVLGILAAIVIPQFIAVPEYRESSIAEVQQESQINPFSLDLKGTFRLDHCSIREFEDGGFLIEAERTSGPATACVQDFFSGLDYIESLGYDVKVGIPMDPDSSGRYKSLVVWAKKKQD